MRAVILAIVLLQALPYIKNGQCGSGYVQSGGYCVPTTTNRLVIPKLPGGQCPSNFASEAHSCVEMKR